MPCCSRSPASSCPSRATRRTLARVEALFSGHLSSPAELLVVDPGRLRAAGLLLSGTTRLVNRLEGQGPLRRERCPGDGRGWHAVLIDAGSARLRLAWPGHLASVRAHVIGHVRDLDLPAAAAAMSHFATDYAHRSV